MRADRTPLLAHPRRGPVRGSARSGERGASLILAILFITVILTLTVALISAGFTGAASLKPYRQERVLRYSADGALQSAIQMVKADATLGAYSASPPACSLTYPLTEDLAGGAVQQVVVSGSVLTVACTYTPGQTTSGIVVDGAQEPRDVTFTVTCNQTGGGSANARIGCGGSGTARVVGRARVRYQINYDISDTTRWAVVPKLVSFSTVRG